MTGSPRCCGECARRCGCRLPACTPASSRWPASAGQVGQANRSRYSTAASRSGRWWWACVRASRPLARPTGGCLGCWRRRWRSPCMRCCCRRSYSARGSGWSPMAAGGCLPRHPTQRPVVVAAGRRGQPAPPAGAWPCPPRWRLGAGLSSAVTAPSPAPGPDLDADRAFQCPANRAHRQPDGYCRNFRPDRTRHLQQRPRAGFSGLLSLSSPLSSRARRSLPRRRRSTPSERRRSAIWRLRRGSPCR